MHVVGWKLALIVDASCVPLALTKTWDTCKNGVEYHQPEDSDNIKTACEFYPYLEYDYREEAHTKTERSTVKRDSYTLTRDTIMLCLQNIFELAATDA